ncbi:MAG: hypothetical protein FD149_1946 [Rhodospirillaceae bacterium]|nr:MAG: hypothetical protein FD149_1946 [Rhodospirillaceae bacterium]
MAHHFCRPVWKRFVTTLYLTGDLPARDFANNACAANILLDPGVSSKVYPVIVTGRVRLHHAQRHRHEKERSHDCQSHN